MPFSKFILMTLAIQLTMNCFGQNLGDFTPLPDLAQNSDFVIPSSHTFQRIIERGFFIGGDAILAENLHDNEIATSQSQLVDEDFTFRDRPDFTAYVPKTNGSSSNGFLSINHELAPGGVSILDISLNGNELWQISRARVVDFSAYGGTTNNCSGGITPWGTVLTCEENKTDVDANMDGYNDYGWTCELDPASASVIGKRWAMGNFKHENAVVHHNERTVYQGTDAAAGYLYKFVSTNAQDLSVGLLYVYKGSKNGSGNWLLVPNTTPAERNATDEASTALLATAFNGIEDVDIGHDGWVYFAVKGESTIYRFMDSDPLTGTTVPQMQPFIGPATFAGGLPGIDNLSFDCEGNLWALQDGGKNHIWFVEEGTSLPVIFGRTPLGSEPTGLTFSPDCRYGFMSIQHPNAANNVTTQTDAAGNIVAFDKDITLVFARKEDLGNTDQFCTTTVVDVTINAVNDDVEENAADGTMYSLSTDLELVDDDGVDGFNGAGQTVGLRFNNLGILPGAKIKRAYLQFTVDETDNAPGAILIQAEATDHAAAFMGSTYELSSKSKTAACALWNEIPFWNQEALAGTKQRTVDVSTIVEEITDRPGWAYNNSMLFILSGTGERVAIAFDGSATRAPRLHVEYESCGADEGCNAYGHKTLLGALPTNTYKVENELIIRGSSSSPNMYHFSAGSAIELKPGTEFSLGSVMNLSIAACRLFDGSKSY